MSIAQHWGPYRTIAHGGWCSKGRCAEDGIIPNRYTMQETESKEYKQRTKWNVRDSDATLIISLLPELVRSADKHGLIMIEDSEDDEALELIAAELEARSRKAAGEMDIIVSYSIYDELEESEIKDDK